MLALQLLPACTDPEGSAGNNATTVRAVSVLADWRQHGIVIPATAIMASGDGEESQVWVVKADSSLEARPVTVESFYIDGTAAVSQGLDGSEKIVTAGLNTLRQGMKVNPYNQSGQ